VSHLFLRPGIMKLKNILLAVKTLLFLFLLNSCIGAKSGAHGSGRHLFETFYVGDEGTQYFIKPLQLKNDKAEQEADLDFVFRYKNQVKDSVTINISFLGKEMIKKVDSCSFQTSKGQLRLQSLKYLFLERQGKKYNLRYSSKAALADVYKLFQDNKWVLSAYISQQDNKYSCPPSTEKKIAKIYHHIFSLF
jgi:hypothetical protein